MFTSSHWEACSAELLIKSENRSASMYISLWPLCRGCQRECQLMTAVLDICWLGTKRRLQIPFTQPTKHPSNGNFFLTLDSIRSIFQWGKLLKSGRLICVKKKVGFFPPWQSKFLLQSLTKNTYIYRKFMWLSQRNPFLCYSKDIFLALFDTLLRKMLLKIRFL